jgi:hypothetical protein
MLDIVGASASSHATKDWPLVRKESPEAHEVKVELARIHAGESVPNSGAAMNREESDEGEYAMQLNAHFWWVTSRVFQQYWRNPA